MQATPHDDVGAGSDSVMLQVAAGDHDAFETLYLSLAPGVYGLALLVTDDRTCAEEVTRHVFADLWVRAGSFDPSRGTARTWAMTLTHRAALEAARRRSGVNHRATTNTQPDALRAASEQQRLAISLTCFSEFTPDEVALALGLSTSSLIEQLREGLRRMGARPATAAAELVKRPDPLAGQPSSA